MHWLCSDLLHHTEPSPAADADPTKVAAMLKISAGPSTHVRTFWVSVDEWLLWT